MVKQLDQVCDTTEAMATIGTLRQRVDYVTGQTSGRLHMLEDANKKIDEHEKEIADLTKWMEETRTHMSMLDTSYDLKEQLTLQEVFIELNVLNIL